MKEFINTLIERITDEFIKLNSNFVFTHSLCFNEFILWMNGLVCDFMRKQICKGMRKSMDEYSWIGERIVGFNNLLIGTENILFSKSF